MYNVVSDMIKDIGDKKVVLYGAGILADLMINRFRLIGIEVYSIVVDEPYLANATGYNGVKVREINSIEDKMNKVLILSMHPNAKSKINLERVRKAGYNNIIDIDEDGIYSFSEAVVKFHLLNEYKLNFEEEIIKINDFIIVNPFSAIKCFFEELGDIIANVYNDYKYVFEGPYEHEYVSINANEEEVVFDCGANIGLFSAYAASKNNKVYSFEPTSTLCDTFLKKLRELYANKIEICEYALSDSNGEAEFYSYDSPSMNTLNNYNRDDVSDVIKVKLITIDDYVNKNNIKRVDFIKADIEGAERLMLKGAKETLRRFSPKLSICTYHLPDDKEVLEKIVLEANPNYIIEHKWKKMYAYVPNRCIEENL